MTRSSTEVQLHMCLLRTFPRDVFFVSVIVTDVVTSSSPSFVHIARCCMLSQRRLLFNALRPELPSAEVYRPLHRPTDLPNARPADLAPPCSKEPPFHSPFHSPFLPNIATSATAVPGLLCSARPPTTGPPACRSASRATCRWVSCPPGNGICGCCRHQRSVVEARSSAVHCLLRLLHATLQPAPAPTGG